MYKGNIHQDNIKNYQEYFKIEMKRAEKKTTHFNSIKRPPEETK